MYKIRKLDEQAIENAEKKWNSIAKPLHSLGVFEEIVKNIAGMQGTQNIDIKKRCVLVMCADNGVVCEGVTPDRAGSYGGCDGKLCKGCNKRVCYGKKYRCGRCTD